MQWLSAQDYERLLEQNGLRVVAADYETALMPLRSWQDIGRYWLFIEGALPGVPIPIAADALEHAAAEAFEELGISDVPRSARRVCVECAPSTGMPSPGGQGCLTACPADDTIVCATRGRAVVSSSGS
jgi:hypothetical protein